MNHQRHEEREGFSFQEFPSRTFVPLVVKVFANSPTTRTPECLQNPVASRNLGRGLKSLLSLDLSGPAFLGGGQFGHKCP